MIKRLITSDRIKELEYELSKIKFVQSKFPDVQFTSHTAYDKNILNFYSKTINSAFEKLDFQTHYNKLCVVPYSEVNFEYNNTSEVVRVLPIPEKIILARKTITRVNNKYEDIIRFSRFSFNNKKNAFNQDKLYQDCMVAIVEFVKKYRDIKTDIKHLDPRLKKLLAFS